MKGWKMARYSCDLKMFVRIEVEAETPQDAEREAQRFAEGAWPDDGNFLSGWQSAYSADETTRIVEVGCLDTGDGCTIEDEDGDEVDPDDVSTWPSDEQGCRSCREAIETRALPCDECGAMDGDEGEAECGQCDGTGRIGGGLSGSGDDEDCPFCDGTGQLPDHD